MVCGLWLENSLTNCIILAMMTETYFETRLYGYVTYSNQTQTEGEE